MGSPDRDLFASAGWLVERLLDYLESRAAEEPKNVETVAGVFRKHSSEALLESLKEERRSLTLLNTLKKSALLTFNMTRTGGANRSEALKSIFSSQSLIRFLESPNFNADPVRMVLSQAVLPFPVSGFRASGLQGASSPNARKLFESLSTSARFQVELADAIGAPLWQLVGSAKWVENRFHTYIADNALLRGRQTQELIGLLQSELSKLPGHRNQIASRHAAVSEIKAVFEKHEALSLFEGLESADFDIASSDEVPKLTEKAQFWMELAGAIGTGPWSSDLKNMSQRILDRVRREVKILEAFRKHSDLLANPNSMRGKQSVTADMLTSIDESPDHFLGALAMRRQFQLELARAIGESLEWYEHAPQLARIVVEWTLENAADAIPKLPERVSILFEHNKNATSDELTNTVAEAFRQDALEAGQCCRMLNLPQSFQVIFAQELEQIVRRRKYTEALQTRGRANENVTP